MKVLVTGAAGFFGSNLCEYLLENGHQVVGVDNFNNFYPPKIKEYHIRDIAQHPGFKLYRDDILDLEGLEKIFNRESPFDGIVHLAAWAGITYSIEKPAIYVRNNVEGTVNVAELAVKHKINNLVFASSSSVYGTNPTPFHEDMKINDPLAPYPATKRAAELILQTYSKNFGLNITVTRIFNPTAPRMRPDLVLPKLIRSVEYGQGFPLYWTAEEMQKTGRDYCYIGHMLDAIHKILSSPFRFEIINLGNSSPVTLRELISLVEEVTGKKVNIEQLPKRKGEMLLTYANIDKARDLLGYNPTTTMKEAIKMYHDWYLKQEDWYRKGSF
jgi:UDP-glucuronate 4-epimerase